MQKPNRKKLYKLEEINAVQKLITQRGIGAGKLSNPNFYDVLLQPEGSRAMKLLKRGLLPGVESDEDEENEDYDDEDDMVEDQDSSSAIDA